MAVVYLFHYHYRLLRQEVWRAKSYRKGDSGKHIDVEFKIT